MASWWKENVTKQQDRLSVRRSISVEPRKGSLADSVAALQVTRTVGLRETWYFGLQYLDSRGLISWLDPAKKVSSAFSFYRYGQCEI